MYWTLAAARAQQVYFRPPEKYPSEAHKGELATHPGGCACPESLDIR